MDVELEEVAAADDLQRRQDDAPDVDVRDEHVARHLADVLQEAQVQVLVLQPRQLQIAVDVRAVGVTIAQVTVMVLFIRRSRHATVGADTNCSLKKKKKPFVTVALESFE